jgi:5-methylcytosine-specific restriction endonuclease McrA
MKELKEIPPVMIKRALWARDEIINHPENVHIDYDELLAWVYNTDDNIWYSIDGNYSQQSPEEKMEKRNKWKKVVNEYEIKYDEMYYKKYSELKYWNKIRLDILKRDNYTCQLCGKIGDSRLHIHHIEKKNQNGPDTEDNLITVCPSCHPKADHNLYNPDWYFIEREK